MTLSLSSPEGLTLPKLGTVTLGRVSTEELARGDSVNRQIEAGRRFALASLASETNGEFYEIKEEGISGKTFNRVGIKEILHLAQSGKIRFIVVYDVSRFGRNAKEGLETLDRLLTLGVDVKVITEALLNFRTRQGRKQWTQLLADAECERGVYADKAIEGMTAKAQKGDWKGGPPSYGLTRNAEKSLILDTEPARLVLVLGEGFARTGSVVAAIQQFVDKEGLIQLPPTAHSKTGRGPTLSRNFVDRVLRNPIYAGFVPAPSAKTEQTKHIQPDYEYEGRPYYRSLHERIFSPALWKRIQEHITLAKRQTRNQRAERKGSDEYLLQSLLTCGSCGRKFTDGGGSGQTGAKKIHSYVCQSDRNDVPTVKCPTCRLPGHAMEIAVVRSLAGLFQHPDLISTLVGNAVSDTARLVESMRAKLAALVPERAEIKRSIESAVTFICSHENTALADELVSRVETMRAREKAIQAETVALNEKIEATVVGLPSEDKIRQALGKFEELMSYLPRARLKQLIRLFVQDIMAKRIFERTGNLERIARSSEIVRMKITLNGRGIQYVAQATVTALEAASYPTWSSGKSPGEAIVTFEVRRGGNKGNTVHFINPAWAEAKPLEFTDETPPPAVIMDGTHPIFRAQKAYELFMKGTLKKDVALALGISAGYITFLVRILKLDKTILNALKEPRNHHLRQWFGLCRLNRLTALSSDLQLKAFEEQRQAAPNPPRGSDATTAQKSD